MANTTDYIFVDSESLEVCNLVVDLQNNTATYIPFYHDSDFVQGGYTLTIPEAREKYRSLQKLWGEPQALAL